VISGDQHKLSLIAEFLKESVVGCSVLYDHEDKERVARSYRIVNDTTRKMLHHVSISRAFLDDHAEGQIIPALRSLALVECLRIVGTRGVIVRTERIDIEPGTRSRSDSFTTERAGGSAR
jgi:hypothetical protein